VSFLARIAVVAGRRYRLVFAVFAVLLLTSLFAITRLAFDTDVLALLPQEEPVVREFVATLEDFGNIDYLLVALRIPEGAVISPYQTYADRLAARLEAMPQVSSVEYRLSDVQELFEEFASKAVLYLPPEERERLAERVTPAALERRAQEMKRLLTTPQGAALRDLLVLDPFGLVEIFMDRIQGSQGQLSIDWQSGYYLSRDRTLLLMLVEVTEPPQNIPFAEALVAEIEAQAAEVTGEWPEITGGDEGPDLEEGEIAFDPGAAAGDLDGDGEVAGAPPPPPELALGGSFLTNVDEARFIKRDAVINICTSLVLVLSLFLLAFRRLDPLLYAVVPLVSGLILTFGFAAVTLGRLSTATSGTAALLIGLGIDFIIVSYGRFVEERRLGHGLDEAVHAMATYSGRAVVVGAVTTAATFFAFMITDFRGLWEMGFLTGTGILFCLVSVLLLLPALFAWHESRQENREGTVPTFYLHGFGTDAVIRYSLRHPRTVLGVGVLLTVGLGIATTGLRFESDMAAMRPKGNRGIEVAQEIGEKFGSGFNYMMLVVRGATAAEALERTAAAAARAEDLVGEGILYRVDSATALIPPPERQQEVLAWLETERSGRLDMERVRADFETALAAENLRATPFEEGIDLFEAAVSPREPLGVDDYAGSAEARRLLGRYLQETGDGWKSVVYLFPPENRYRKVPPPEAEALAEELGPDVRLVGNNVVNAFVRVRIVRDAWIAGLLGLALVAFLIYLDFRKLRDMVGALTPLLVGIVWMLGTMALLGIDVNFMNIFVTTMIIGIGVDYGLHVLHRYRETVTQGAAELERGLLETGKAILVAALSTICGFGSMSISHYPGLRTTGYVAILGALATSLVAITLLPAWFALRNERKARR
jgi:uncharacterized protein